ncbi:MAG: hypothetical protein JWQ09_4921 [Segetibacter sp.]|nr:hypothetical protein [Segetibacter sp.]
MQTLQTNFEAFVSKLQASGKVSEMSELDTKSILLGIESDMENFLIDGQRKHQESLVEMTSLILTA